MFESLNLLALVPGLPLLAAIVTAVLGPRILRHRSHWPALLAIGGSFFISCVLLQRVSQWSPTEGAVGVEQWKTFYTWLAVPGDGNTASFLMDVTLRLDPLTSIMLVMVTFIASLVVLFSIGYMHDDPGYWRFFTYVSLFVFSMAMLVTASNYLLLFVFWEAVGVCSYLLIGFWYTKPSAAAAGMKAFLVNRVGDFGLTLAVLLMWLNYGTLNFHDTDSMAGILGQQRLTDQLPYLGGGIGLAICLLLLLGACGKSAQFPLHVWLPDAMEGPTPVSALIHAATMVTAGVYLVTRSSPLFAALPAAQLTVSLVGGGTALMAALIALTQNDLKRVLAYSTVSQLGYMFLSLGTGSLSGIIAGMFHLFTHAFFKALLFLGSGSVMHAMGHVIDMRRFSGLRHIMPITHATFAVGCLALSGIFPLAGFWSKDAILVAVHDEGRVAHAELTSEVSFRPDVSHEVATSHVANDAEVLRATVFTWLYRAALVTAFLTAFYTFRAFFLTFYGRLVIPDEAGHHAHESPPTMAWPLLVLAVCSVVIGLVGANANSGLPAFLAKTPSLAVLISGHDDATGHASSHTMIAVTSTAVACSGIALAAFLYLGRRDEVDLLSEILQMKWLEQAADLRWLDGVGYRLGIPVLVRGAERCGCGWLTRSFGTILQLLVSVLISPLWLGYYISPYRLSAGKFFIDELYQWFVVFPILKFSEFLGALDRLLVDGIVNLTGRLPRDLGGLVRRSQTGVVPFYGLSLIFGTLVIYLFSVLFARS